MIYQTRFPYGTSEILLRSRSELPDSLASDIARFVKFSSDDLNPLVKGSSAYRFNNTQQGFPVESSAEFIQFLNLLLELQKINPNSHYFSDHSEGGGILIDSSKNKILKNSDTTFNSMGIKNPFVMDSIKNFLVTEKGFDDFLIIYSNLYNASGEKEWRVVIPELQHGNTEAELGILNSAAVISEYNTLKPKKSLTKFGFTPLFTDPEYVLINADSLIKAHTLVDLAHSNIHDLDFHNFASSSSSKIMVKTKSGEIHSFPLA